MQVNYRKELPALLKALDLPMTAIEVGTAEGLFAEHLLKNGIEKLYLVDAWQHLEQFGDGGYPQSWHDNNYKEVLERTYPYKEKVIILCGLTSEMAKDIPDESVSMVYIDADHSYKGCMRDLENYYSKVVKGGIIALHDYRNLSYGVNKAVKDFFVEMGYELDDINETFEDGDLSMVSAWVIK